MWVGHVLGKSSASGTDRSMTLPDFTKPSNAGSAEASVAIDWAHHQVQSITDRAGAPEHGYGGRLIGRGLELFETKRNDIHDERHDQDDQPATTGRITSGRPSPCSGSRVSPTLRSFRREPEWRAACRSRPPGTRLCARSRQRRR